MMRPPSVSGAAARRAFALLLYLYPPEFRRAYGAAMWQLVSDQRGALGAAGPGAVARFWARVVLDVVRTTPGEHVDALARAVRRVARARCAPSLPGATPAPTLVRTHAEVHMVIAALNVVVALLLGFGAALEIVHGIRGGEVQPLVIGVAGVAATALLALSGVARWRRWPSARRLLVAAAAVLVLFHAYAALPPHRNVGVLALLVGAGYGLVLLGMTLRPAAHTPRG